MGMQATLTFGSTTINLMGSGCKIKDGFRPAPANEADASVVDEMELLFVGSNAAARTLIQGINRLLVVARAQKHLRASKQFVYFNWAVNATDTTYRARVFDGMIDIGSQLTRDWKGGRARMRLRLERVPFWEGPLTAVPLTNDNGTDVEYPTYLKVYFASDDVGASPNKRQNWALIDGDDLEGDMPGPVVNYLRMDGTNFLNQLIMGVYADVMGLGRPDSNIEIGTILWAGGTLTADAGASGGNYREVVLGASMADLVTTSVAMDPAKFYSSYFRVLLRTFELPTDGAWFQIKLYDAQTGIVFAESAMVQIDTTGMDGTYTNLFDLGVVRILPILQYPPLTLNPVSIAIRGYVSGGGGAANLNTLQLIPVDYFAWLKMVENGKTGSSGFPLVDGWGDDETSYEDLLGLTAQVVFEQRLGSGIFLQPGVDNYVFWSVLPWRDAVSPESLPVTEYGTVGMQYRPRRRNI